MSVKLVLFKSEEKVICDIKELLVEDPNGENNPCGFILNKPYKVIMNVPMFLSESVNDKQEAQVTISPWMSLSKDEEYLVPKDWIVTVMEPIDSLLEMYQKQINEEY